MRAQFLLALLGHAAAQNLVALLNGDFEELDGAAPSDWSISPTGASVRGAGRGPPAVDGASFLALGAGGFVEQESTVGAAGRFRLTLASPLPSPPPAPPPTTTEAPTTVATTTTEAGSGA